MRLEYEFVFDKKTGRLKTDQFCFGSEFTLLHDEEAFQVWKRHHSHVFSGTGRPQIYTPTRLLITKVVRIQDGCLICIKVKEIEPGHSWQKATRDLIEECKSMKE